MRVEEKASSVSICGGDGGFVNAAAAAVCACVCTFILLLL